MGVVKKVKQNLYTVTPLCSDVTASNVLKALSEYREDYRLRVSSGMSKGFTLTPEKRAELVAYLRQKKQQSVIVKAPSPLQASPGFKLSPTQQARLDMWKQQDQKTNAQSIWDNCIEHAKREGADTSLILHHEAKDGVWSVWIADNMCGELVAGILEHELRKACRRLTSDASITFIYEAPPRKVASMKVVQYVFGQVDDVIREINNRAAKSTKPRSEQYIIAITQVQQFDAEGRHIKNVGSKDAEELRKSGIPMCF